MKLRDKVLSWLSALGIMRFMAETDKAFGVGGLFNAVSVAAQVAIAANVLAPTSLVTRVADAGGLIKTITPPYTGFGGVIYLIAGSTPYTWDATGNIAKAGTSTAQFRAIPFVYDQTTALWYPAVVA